MAKGDNLPRGYAQDMETLNVEALEKEITTCCKTIADLKLAMSLDKKVVKAKNDLAAAKKKYQNEIDLEDGKAGYCVSVLRGRGYKGHKTFLDQLSLLKDEGEKAEEKTEEKTEEKAAKKPAKKAKKRAA